MKQEKFRLCTTAKREEIDWVLSESVHEVVPRVCGFNKQGACLNYDVGKFVKQKEINH